MMLRLRDEEGSTLPLVIFFGALALALVLIVAAASSLYLERKRLFTLADGAALVGAEAFELSELLPSPSGALRPRLTPGPVSAAVDQYLTGNPVGAFDGLAVDQATTLDGSSATVTLSSVWHPPVVTLFVPEGLRIEATSTARAVFD